MDLDLALVRAFVTAAEELHFGRAAAQLHMTQQALSKRIRRLEDMLGTMLFVRSTRAVSLSEGGRRFLPLARETLWAAEKAVAAVQRSDEPLRVDVMQEHLAPVFAVRATLDDDPELRIEISARRGLDRSLPAILRDEIDMAFGRMHDHGVRIGDELAFDHIRLEPIMAIVPKNHPLAQRDEIAMNDIRPFGMWNPSPGTPTEWSAFLRTLAHEFGIAIEFANVAGTNIEQILARGPDDGQVFVTGADVANPVGPDVVVTPVVDPSPLYPWSVFWRRQDKHQQVRRFVTRLRRMRDDGDWCVYDERHWLPDADLASLREWQAARSAGPGVRTRAR